MDVVGGMLGGRVAPGAGVDTGGSAYRGGPLVSRVLVLSFDPVTERMPGPAIRAWNLAAQLATEHAVTLASTAGADRTHPAMEVVGATGADVDVLAPGVDVVFAPSSVVRRHPIVVTSGVPLCIDMYDPTHLENLEAVGAAGDEAHVKEVAHQVSVLNDDLLHGDFFLCASQRQHDFWLGSLASLGRVNPSTYAADPMLGNLVAVVPFGIDPDPPRPEPGALRLLFPEIGPTDPVLIWGGGVYNWFDPLSLLERARRVAGPSADAAPGVPGHASSEPGNTRDAGGHSAAHRERPPRAHWKARLLQSWVGAVQPARRLLPRRRHRSEYSPGARRDVLLVPHARAGLCLGGIADRPHRGGRAVRGHRRRWRRSRGSRRRPGCDRHRH